MKKINFTGILNGDIFYAFSVCTKKIIRNPKKYFFLIYPKIIKFVKIVELE